MMQQSIEPVPHDNAVFYMEDLEHLPNKVVTSDMSHEQLKSHQENHHHAHGRERRPTMVDSTESVTLTWQNINVKVSRKKRAFCRGPDPNIPQKLVLNNVYGIAKPGMLLAVMGASGSGKTTLLNTLTSRAPSDALKVTGDIRINGVEVGGGIRNISAYVHQDDLFISTMTVREHLRFRAILRMEEGVSHSRRIERVEELLQETGLTKCADNLIGDPARTKGISGGEMRRLALASELLTNPPLLFCDEPTSGLDFFMADTIVQILQSLAQKGKTVMCTIHQPSSEIFAKFHNLMILSEGRVAFMGTVDEALGFYSSVGYPCPVNFNPSDFYIMTMAVAPGIEDECKARITAICDAFESSQLSKDVKSETALVCKFPKKTGLIYDEAVNNSSSRFEVAWHTQFAVVFQRCWNTILRDPILLRIRVINTVILAVVLGLIFLQVSVNQNGVMNINGVLFLLLINMTFSNVFGVLNTFPLETPIFYREYGIGLYSSDVYFICKSLAELPSFIFIPFLFCCITYWMIGLFASAEAFFIFVGILILSSNIAVSFGYIISALANSVTTALAMSSPMLIPLMMFGGFFLNSISIPKYFIWLEYLSWFKYANEFLSVNQWQRIDHIDCPVMNGNCTTGCLFKNGDAVIKYLNYDKGRLMLNLGLLILLLLAFRLIAYLILFIKARRSKR